jgi:uncharacterized protein (TIGR02231 family)
MTSLPTTITAVTVYPDRARVTRSGTARLESGLQHLELTELPLTLDPASLRASAHGTARARLLSVDVRREFYAETPAERVRELETQVEGLQDQINALDAQTETLQEERKAVFGLAGAAQEFARGLALGKSNAAGQMALFDALRGRVKEVNAALQRLAVERRDVERQLQQAQKELEALRSASGRERYTATVEVEVSAAGDLTVEATYVVTNAGWSPLYDLRLLEQEEKPSLEVGYLAQVTQRTGEEWTDVALILSTARPALAGTLPELEPWYIQPHRPRPPKDIAMRKVAGAPQMTMAAEAEPEAAPAPAPVEEAVATVETTGAAVTYRVPGKATLPTDGAPHKVTVARFALPPTLDYVTAPKIVAAVYRRAKTANDSPYTLLPGPVNLFAGEEFVGTTQLDLTPPGGEIELYLGTDDRVHVERELKRREVDKRLLADRRRLIYGYEIRLENLLDTPARLTLHDPLPVPRNEEIKVRLEDAAPQPTEQTELNLLRWEVTLKPREKRTVRFDFSVEHPREMEVWGLP